MYAQQLTNYVITGEPILSTWLFFDTDQPESFNVGHLNERLSNIQALFLDRIDGLDGKLAYLTQNDVEELQDMLKVILHLKLTIQELD